MRVQQEDPVTEHLWIEAAIVGPLFVLAVIGLLALQRRRRRQKPPP
jgi:hypothetical protein